VEDGRRRLLGWQLLDADDEPDQKLGHRQGGDIDVNGNGERNYTTPDGRLTTVAGAPSSTTTT
jgi:hypothetical protein